MGKLLVINGADFGANAVENVSPIDLVSYLGGWTQGRIKDSDIGTYGWDSTSKVTIYTDPIPLSDAYINGNSIVLQFPGYTAISGGIKIAVALLTSAEATTYIAKSPASVLELIEISGRYVASFGTDISSSMFIRVFFCETLSKSNDTRKYDVMPLDWLAENNCKLQLACLL